MANELAKPMEKITSLFAMVEARKGELADALPKQIPADRFIRTFKTYVGLNPSLADCSPKSVIVSIMRAAQFGLLPDGREAALVQYRNNKAGTTDAQFVPMVAGLVKCARNSGEISSIQVETVYRNDKFEVQYGDYAKIDHVPNFEDRGEPFAWYAIVTLKSGERQRAIMSKAEIDKRRNASKCKDSGPWVTWPDEMAKKTVLKYCLKLCPSSTDLQGLEDDDNEASGYEPIQQARVESRVNPSLAEIMGKSTTRQLSAETAPIPPAITEPQTPEEIPDYTEATAPKDELFEAKPSAQGTI